MPRKKKFKVQQCDEDAPLGLLMRDKVTGFQGIAIATTDYLFGCRQYHIKPQVVKDGKLESAIAFDYLQLEIIGTGIYKPDKPKTDTDDGGIHPDTPDIF